MHIFTTQSKLANFLNPLRLKGNSIGFTPTMGALHLGHISLVEQAIKENNVAICSIFVNPTQFDNSSDLQKYPNTLQQDLEMLENAGCDVVFVPQIKEMYPAKTSAQKFDFNGLDQQMEGAFRPGHFDGVATIVNAFFELIQPQKAYFGEKDFQQLRIIQTLASQKHPNTQIIPMPIYREKDGLAMSSRNLRLQKKYRQAAPLIYESLQLAKKMYPTHEIPEILEEITQLYQNSLLELEYFMFCDETTLMPITEKNEAKNIRAFVAAYAGEIRLIDNLKIYEN